MRQPHSSPVGWLTVLICGTAFLLPGIIGQLTYEISINTKLVCVIITNNSLRQLVDSFYDVLMVSWKPELVFAQHLI